MPSTNYDDDDNDDDDDDDDDQSVSMGGSGEDGEGHDLDDGESSIPMKRPSDSSRDDDVDRPNAANDSSFLDDDFLTFSSVDNGGAGDNGNNGRRRDGDDRRRCPPPAAARTAVLVPWLELTADDDASTTTTTTTTTRHRRQQLEQEQPRQQQRWVGRDVNNNGDRGYGGIVDGDRDNHRHPMRDAPPPLIRLHNEIVAFVNLMSPTAAEMSLREGVVESVTRLGSSTFGDGAKVLPFGSQVTGLCLPGSDVDFVVRLPPPPKGGERGGGADDDDDDDDDGGMTDATTTAAKADENANPLRRFANVMLNVYGTRSELLEGEDENDSADVVVVVVDGGGGRGGGREYLSYLEVIENTRVPLVKFTIAPHDIDVDVCFDQPHGPESADLMHRFMESMPPLRPLTFVLKYFLASRDINKPFTGGIGSYLLQLMIVSYLQHRAREDMARGHGAGGRHYNLGSLLLDFLELYGVDFNYVTTGISVRHDGYYFPKGLSERRNSFWQPTRPFGLAMENPLDPTADVGAGAFRMQMIQRIFGHAFRTLLAYVSEPAEHADSILARIIPPTEEMERRMIAKRGGAGSSIAAVVDDDPVVDDDTDEDEVEVVEEEEEEEEEEGSDTRVGDIGAKKRKRTAGNNAEKKKNARKREVRRRKLGSKQSDDGGGGVCGGGGDHDKKEGGGGGKKKRGKKRVRNSI
jgi:non-canonical poly(A) RNA polymerase PAPD5/7